MSDDAEILRLLKSGAFIAGIHNYCDRWCERCPFTSKCMVFAMEKATGLDEGSHDPENEAFWDRLANSMRSAIDTLKDIAAKRGINLDAVDGAQILQREAEIEESLKHALLPKLANEYAHAADQWFKSASEDFATKGEELRGLELMDIEGADPLGEAREIEDAVEVIRWYQFPIAVKVMRAYSGITRILMTDLANETNETESDADTGFDLDFEDDQPTDSAIEVDAVLREAELSDSNGTAKVALIAIDRSIAAWSRMRHHFPDRADEILDLLVLLDRLRRASEKQFPEARAFKRPGFDD